MSRNLVIKDGFVYKQEQIDQINSYEVLIDMLYHIDLSLDKAIIYPDSNDTATIIARVVDYFGESNTDFGGRISFELAGEVVEVQAVAGEASITFKSGITGEYKITASAPMVRQGEVVINVK